MREDAQSTRGGWSLRKEKEMDKPELWSFLRKMTGSTLVDTVVQLLSDVEKGNNIKIVEECAENGSIEDTAKILSALVSSASNAKKAILWLRTFASGVCDLYPDSEPIDPKATIPVSKTAMHRNPSETNFRYVFGVFLGMFESVSMRDEYPEDFYTDFLFNLEVLIDEFYKYDREKEFFQEKGKNSYTVLQWNKFEDRLQKAIGKFPEKQIPKLRKTLYAIAVDISKESRYSSYYMSSLLLNQLFYFVCNKLDAIEKCKAIGIAV